ncbi:MAG: metal-dependent hydrolase [Terriglobales bacterium]
MFLGHFGFGLALKAKAPRTSLGTLFAAAQWLDLVWPVLVLLGWESLRIVPSSNPLLRLEFVHFPYTHSLAAAIVWSVLFAGVYGWRTGHRTAARWLGLGVFSHWVLDWISHRPDLQLAPGLNPRLGLGLWSAPVAAEAVEFALFAAGVWIYARSTRARDRRGIWGFWLLAAFLVVVAVANLAGPAPGSARAVAFSALFIWLLVAWAAWCDRHRAARTVASR